MEKKQKYHLNQTEQDPSIAGNAIKKEIQEETIQEDFRCFIFNQKTIKQSNF